MELTNKQIYEYAEKIENAFLNEKKYFPVKINFIIQKNKQILQQEKELIEKTRFEIIKKFGYLTKDESGNGYHIPQEKIEETNKELNDLLEFIQDLDIHTFNIEDIENVEFTPQQMDAILFMIDGDEDDLDD